MFTPTGPEFAAVMQKSPWNDNNDLVTMRETLLANGMAMRWPPPGSKPTRPRRNVKRQYCAEHHKADPGCQVVQRYFFQVLRGLPKGSSFAQMLCGFEGPWPIRASSG